jgi:hypothetical protein
VQVGAATTTSSSLNNDVGVGRTYCF